MKVADPQGPPSDTGGGSLSTPLVAASEAEAIEVIGSKAAPIITTMLVYKLKGQMCPFSADIVNAVGCRTSIGEVPASGRSCTPKESKLSR